MRRVFLVGPLVAVLAAGLPPAAADDPPPTANQLKLSVNRLKQIALAFHSYADANRRLPNNVYKDGKALLSWRVLILPYIEETPLFNQFKLDEAWDGPTNKALVEKMPKLYAPVRGKAKAGETFYRAFAGKGLLFGPDRAAGAAFPAAIPDGTSNTALVVEAGAPVVWTMPSDLEFPEKGPLPKLGGMFDGVANVALADGSVMRLRADPDPDALRKLIDPADGFPVDFAKLRAK